MSDIKESAKATQEVAKTASKAIGASEKFGSWISKYLHTSLEEGIGIFEDKLKYMRWQNQINFMKKAEEKLNKLGFSQPIKPIPLKFAIPILESASIEDNEYLQSLWANLLINASTNKNNFNLEKFYINILQQLSSLEAKIIEAIYSKYNKHLTIEYNKNIITENLPDSIKFYIEPNYVHETEETYKAIQIYENLKIPNNNLKIALLNLDRLKCIKIAIKNDEYDFKIVHPTIMGLALYQSIKNI